VNSAVLGFPQVEHLFKTVNSEQRLEVVVDCVGSRAAVLTAEIMTISYCLIYSSLYQAIEPILYDIAPGGLGKFSFGGLATVGAIDFGQSIDRGY
jgi:hypothetical protein